MKNKISVVIPVYNGSKGIVRCLESVINQTYKKLEMIIVDDGSTDDSAQKIRQFMKAKYDSSISIKFIQQENQGVFFARNRGIEAATGQYVAFIDQDDMVAPEYFQSYLTVAEREKSTVVVGGYERVRETGERIRRIQLRGYSWDKFVVVAPWAHLYSRQFLIDNDIKNIPESIGEDIYFNFLAYSAADKVSVTPDFSYKWMYNPVSVSNSKQTIINDKVDPIQMLNDVVNRVANQEFLKSEEVEYYFARYLCWFMLFTFRRSRKPDIEKMYNKITDWLEKNYPNYEQNRFVRFHRPKGEPLSFSLSVWVFYFLKRLGLALPLLKCLSQNKEN